MSNKEGGFKIIVNCPGNQIAETITNTINGDVYINRNKVEKQVDIKENNENELANAGMSLRDVLNVYSRQLKQGRRWFSIVKVLMWKNYVPLGDFAGAVALIESFLPNVKLDAKDLSKLNVLSFSKELEKWDPENAPVKGNLFEQYRSIASNAMNMIPEKE